MSMSEDLCPMCKGSGKHDLRPPNGEIYRFRCVGVDGNGPTFWIRLEQVINASAEEGYEVQQVLDGEGYTAVVMKWRWL